LGRGKTRYRTSSTFSLAPSQIRPRKKERGLEKKKRGESKPVSTISPIIKPPAPDLPTEREGRKGKTQQRGRRKGISLNKTTYYYKIYIFPLPYGRDQRKEKGG